MAEGGEQILESRSDEKIECELCNKDASSGLFKCLECDMSICLKCAGVHRRIPVVRHHTLIPRIDIQSKTEEDPGEENSTNDREVSKIVKLEQSKTEEVSRNDDPTDDHDLTKYVLRMCSVHTANQISHFCYSCNILICEKCIRVNHYRHKGINIKELMDRRRIKEEANPALQNNLKVTRIMKKMNDLSSDKSKQSVYERIQQNMAELAKLEKEEIAIKTDDKYERRKEKLVKRLAKLVDMCDECTEILHNGSDIEVIRAEQQFSAFLANYNNSDSESDDEDSDAAFIPGEIDIEAFRT